MTSNITIPAVAAAIFLGSTQANAATFLKVDFGSSGPETGFLQQNSTNQTHSTANGDVNVLITGQQGIFNQATSGTNDDLYRDFVFKNNGIMTMTLSGAGIAANAVYDLTFWSYYNSEGRNTFLEATAGTTGADTAVISASNSPAPSSLYDPLYSTTGTFTSDNSGNLTVLVKGTGNRPAINAIELDLVPEPSSLALLSLGGLLIARRRRG